MDTFDRESEYHSSCALEASLPYELPERKRPNQTQSAFGKWLSAFSLNRNNSELTIKRLTEKRNTAVRQIPATIIVAVRFRFLERYRKHNESVKKPRFDDRDVERIKTDDKYVSRFISFQMNQGTKITNPSIIDKTIKSIEETLEWRLQNQVLDLTIESFSPDLLSMNIFGWSAALSKKNNGLDITYVIYYRADHYLRVLGRAKETIQLFAFILEQLDRETDGNGPVQFVLECSGFTLNNMDIGFGIDLVLNTFKRFPDLVMTLDMVDAVPLAEAAASICVRVMSRAFLNLDRVRFITKEELLVELGSNNVAKILGGTASNVIWTEDFITNKLKVRFG